MMSDLASGNKYSEEGYETLFVNLDNWTVGIFSLISVSPVTLLSSEQHVAHVSVAHFTAHYYQFGDETRFLILFM